MVGVPRIVDRYSLVFDEVEKGDDGKTFDERADQGGLVAWQPGHEVYDHTDGEGVETGEDVVHGDG